MLQFFILDFKNAAKSIQVRLQTYIFMYVSAQRHIVKGTDSYNFICLDQFPKKY